LKPTSKPTTKSNNNDDDDLFSLVSNKNSNKKDDMSFDIEGFIAKQKSGSSGGLFD